MNGQYIVVFIKDNKAENHPTLRSKWEAAVYAKELIKFNWPKIPIVSIQDELYNNLCYNNGDWAIQLLYVRTQPNYAASERSEL